MIMALAFLSIIASSCSKDVRETAGSVALSFSASDVARAPGEMDDIAVDGYGFGVFGFDTGLYRYGDSHVNPNFMYNEKVSYDAATARWSYEPVKYWPNGEGELAGTTGALVNHLSFFAYAPYSDMAEDNPAGYCIPTISDQSEPGNPWIVYRIHEDVSQQVDLLYAPTVVDRTLDQAKPDVAARIGFQFRHALACVGEKVRVSCSANLKAALAGEATSQGGKIQVILQNVRIRFHLTERARLTLWSTGTPRWRLLLNGEPTTDRLVTYGEDLGWLLYSTLAAEGGSAWESAGGEGVFYIPVDVPDDVQTATVIGEFIVRRIVGGVTTDTMAYREMSFSMNSYPEGFAPGKKLSNIGVALQ